MDGGSDLTCVQTIGLRVQQDGHLMGWSMIVGASFAYQAVDDSDSTTHDSEATYFILPKNTGLGPGIVTFPMFQQTNGILPSSITINVVATRGGASHPRIQIGFYRGGLTAFDGALFNPSASWDLAQRTFNTNPITGSPWSPSDLIGLEACIQNEAGVQGNNDITLVSGSLTYYPTTNTTRRVPRGWGAS